MRGFEEWLASSEGMAALAGQAPARPQDDEDEEEFGDDFGGGVMGDMTLGSTGGGGLGMTGGDAMDEGEMFDEMELARVVEEDPDSVAFFKAKKGLDKSRRYQKGAATKTIRSKRINNK